MKKFIKTIKENFVFLFGAGLFIYGLFNFSSNRYCDDGGLLPKLNCNNPATYYYYDRLTLFLLIVGAIFIVIGLLKIREQSDSNNAIK